MKKLKLNRKFMIDNLTSSLRDGIKAVIELAHKKGIDSNYPTLEYSVKWMIPSGDSGYRGQHERRIEPSFIKFSQDTKDDLENVPCITNLQKIFSDYAKENGIFLPFGFSAVKSDRLWLVLLETYFEKKNEFAVDENCISQVVTQFINDVTSDTAIMVAYIEIKKFSAADKFSISEGIIFRPITEVDIDAFGRISDASYFAEKRNIYSDSWILEIKKPINKSDAAKNAGAEISLSLNNFYELIDNISIALNLSQAGHASFEILYKSVESPFLYYGHTAYSPPNPISRHPQKINLSAEEILKFQEIYKAFTALIKDESERDLDLALRRLRMSASRTTDSDHLIDCVIGLENLLIPEKGSEIGYKFKMRGAAILPDVFGTAEQRINLMKELYSKRSDIIHGTVSSSENVNDWSIKAENVFRNILLWYVKNWKTLGSRKQAMKNLDLAFVSKAETFRDNR